MYANAGNSVERRQHRRLPLSPLLHWPVARFYVENFGCRASQADGDAIAAAFNASGATQAARLQDVDICVVNTCTVTAEADRNARAYIRRIRRENPAARIVVTGCYAQRAPEEVAALPGVFAVVGNSHKGQTAAVALTGMVPCSGAGRAAIGGDAEGFVPVESLGATRSLNADLPLVLADDIFAHTQFEFPSLPIYTENRTRPSLKVQDGCGNRCTFCVIPSTRGNSRSLPAEQVLDSVREFAAAGGKEMVISGINLGRWGRDLTPPCRLEGLIAEIFESTALPRLRISSVEPMDWTDGLIALFRRWDHGQHPRLARHAHVPLQSGSDAVLRRMHRRYRPWHYAERLAAIRTAAPDAAIGADVMVGFPGESDGEFQESYDFIAAQPLTYLHLFPFSARPGTRAWELHRANPVPDVAVKERMAALRRLIDAKSKVFRAGFVGRRLSAVTLIAKESIAASGRTAALTDNFLAVDIEGNHASNTLLGVEIVNMTLQGLAAVPAR